MTWISFMNSVLPPKNGRTAIITSSPGPRNRSAADKKAGGRHIAVDFSYTGFPKPASGEFPVFCPVSGSVGLYPVWGAVLITDANGLVHGFFHMSKIQVNVGQSVSGGQHIGYMSKVNALAPHVHYQIKKNGKTLNPLDFWNSDGDIFSEPGQEDNKAIHDAEDQGYAVEGEPGSPVGNLNEFRPRQPGIAPKSYSQGALWTNRVPSKEPWPRTMMGDSIAPNDYSNEYERNTNHNPQFTEDSEEGRQKIGVVDGDEVYVRGPFWRR